MVGSSILPSRTNLAYLVDMKDTESVKFKNVFFALFGIVASGIFFIVLVYAGAHFSLPAPRYIDRAPLSYLVSSSKSVKDVYVSFHIDTSGDNFAPLEFGLDAYVQNGHRGMKQTIDSCKDILSEEDNSVVCDGKVYTFALFPAEVRFYRTLGNKKELAATFPVSKHANNLIEVRDSYKLYTDDAEQRLSILEEKY